MLIIGGIMVVGACRLERKKSQDAVQSSEMLIRAEQETN